MGMSIATSDSPNDYWALQTRVYDLLQEQWLARTKFTDEELDRLESCYWGAEGIFFDTLYIEDPAFAMKLRDAVIDAAESLADQLLLESGMDENDPNLPQAEGFVVAVPKLREVAAGLRRWKPSE